ncbi:MAG TPA: hypothetical protein VHH36_03595 [Candidatus Thermoplasmatota archaeon]|nr:hypothetical protein [Candidatus Thermoplasmatota archaeon]
MLGMMRPLGTCALLIAAAVAPGVGALPGDLPPVKRPSPTCLTDCVRPTGLAVPVALSGETVVVGYQFYSEWAQSCRLWLAPTPFEVCAQGNASMWFSSGCPGTPGPNQVCIQVGGSARGNGTLTGGSLRASLDHMTSETCDWSMPGGACKRDFHDPSTGAVVHKHWHDMDGSWQCHEGTSAVDTAARSPAAHVTFKACFKFGTLDGWPEPSGGEGAPCPLGGPLPGVAALGGLVDEIAPFTFAVTCAGLVTLPHVTIPSVGVGR